MSVWTRPVLPALLAPSRRLSPLMSFALVSLAALAAAAAGFAAYAVLAPDDHGMATAQSDWKAPLPTVVELGEPKPASADIQTLTRPIFDKDRRPSKKAAAPASETKNIEETPVGYAVDAIVKHGGVAKAYIVVNGAGEWRKVGDKVDAWTVSDIAADAVALDNGANSVRLQLYNGDPRPADVAPPSTDRRAPPPGAVRPEPPPPSASGLPGEPPMDQAQPSPPADGAPPAEALPEPNPKAKPPQNPQGVRDE